jgi:hypothetical protein
LFVVRLVEIRHDATHGRLPSLDLLQYSAYKALKWLKSQYWTKQAGVLVVSVFCEFANKW